MESNMAEKQSVESESLLQDLTEKFRLLPFQSGIMSFEQASTECNALNNRYTNVLAPGKPIQVLSIFTCFSFFNMYKSDGWVF